MNNLKSIYGSTPPVVKNLIILNVLFYLATIAGKKFGVDLSRVLALYYPLAEHFQPYQFITHMFMHGSLGHLFFNMFALWMFGRVLESVWGGKRFFIYYFVTGLGAAAFYTFVHWIEFAILKGKMSPEQVQMVLENGQGILQNMQNYSDPAMGKLNVLIKGLGKMKLLKNLILVAKNIDKVKKLYKSYPCVNDFDEWEKNVNKVFNDFYDYMEKQNLKNDN